MRGNPKLIERKNTVMFKNQKQFMKWQNEIQARTQ